MLFFVNHILIIICIHFVLLINMDQWYRSDLLLVVLNACPQQGQGTKNWVSSLLLLRKKYLACPRNLSWKEKRKMTGHDIQSKYFLRNPSCNKGMR
jgi:hypothetical protein